MAASEPIFTDLRPLNVVFRRTFLRITLRKSHKRFSHWHSVTDGRRNGRM